MSSEQTEMSGVITGKLRNFNIIADHITIGRNCVGDTRKIILLMFPARPPGQHVADVVTIAVGSNSVHTHSVYISGIDVMQPSYNVYYIMKI